MKEILRKASQYVCRVEKPSLCSRSFFESLLVLTFTMPQSQLLPYIPKCLTLDTYSNDWAFLAVALVHTSNLSPNGFPEFMGNDFFLIGYCIFVRYTTNTVKNLTCLYIIESETDKRTMQVLGNIFTHYKYDFLNQPQFEGVILANVFLIQQIPYYWKKGRVES